MNSDDESFNKSNMTDKLLNNDGISSLSIDEIPLANYLKKLISKINLANEPLLNKDATKNKILYDSICNDIAAIPAPIDILELSISYEEKRNLIEKLFMLHYSTPLTMEFFEIREYITDKIKKYKKLIISEQEYSRYKNIEESLIKNIKKDKPIEHIILDMDISDHDKYYIYTRYKTLKQLESTNSQYHNKIQLWIDAIINIPTEVKPVLPNASISEINKYLCNVKKILDEEIFGLEHVKERILLLLNNRITNNISHGLNLALSGPPGVAKTSIINVLAKIVDLPFFQINMAGMKDSSFLLGHNFTYEGSGPGCIVQALNKMKYKNGIIYFDEFDKISVTENGQEISRALLHITDSSQNDKFHDRYIGEQFNIDLSHIWFIYSLNDKTLIEPTLRDRITIIEVEGYTKTEKKTIVNNYLLPKLLKNICLQNGSVTFSDDAIDYLISLCQSDKINGAYNVFDGSNEKSGIRQLKQLIEEILMKINLLKTVNESDDSDKLVLNFNIKKFSLPIIITKEILIDLKIIKNNTIHNFYHMYS